MKDHEMYYALWRNIVARRKELGWKQKDLQEKSGVGERSIKAMETGEYPVQRPFFVFVAGALGVPVSHILGDSKADRDGASSDVEWMFVLRGVQHRVDFFAALREDMLGNHEQAIAIASRILADTEKDEFRTRTFAILKLSSFICNLGGQENYARALKLLEDLLAEPEARRRKGSHLVAWCRYHQAVALRRLGKPDQARKLLAPLLKRKLHRLGALHQLGVIELEQALHTESPLLFAEAEKKFLACLDGWGHEPDRAQHRAGFSLRRLGQLYAATGQTDLAVDRFLDAHAVFAFKGCMRYLKTTRTELKNLLAA